LAHLRERNKEKLECRRLASLKKRNEKIELRELREQEIAEEKREFKRSKKLKVLEIRRKKNFWDNVWGSFAIIFGIAGIGVVGYILYILFNWEYIGEFFCIGIVVLFIFGGGSGGGASRGVFLGHTRDVGGSDCGDFE